MIGTLSKPFSNSYPPALFLTRLPHSSILYHPFVLLPSPVYKHIYAYHPFFFFKRFYLFDREHKQGEWQAEGEEETGSLLSKEPDVGLDPT